MSVLAMIYFIFVSVNSLFYYAQTTVQGFLAMVFRMSSVFELEEFDFTKREEECEPEQACIKFEDCEFSWGFKTKQEEAGKGPKARGAKVELEVVAKPVLTGINVNMKRGDFLTVVG